MSRLLCSLMLALSVALLGFGPTAVFAAPPCPPGQCFHGNSNQQTDSCTNNGCTETNKPGTHCFSGPDHKC
jgi:hypothetical protein